MTIVPFLDKRLVPTSVDPWIDARSVGGGMNVLGDEQVIGIGAGIWRYTLSGIAVRSPADIREWRRFVAALDGRLNTTRVPWFERSSAPWSTDQFGRTVNAKLVRRYQLDGTQFADADAAPGPMLDQVRINSLIKARIQSGTASTSPAAGETSMILALDPATDVVVDGIALSLTPGIVEAGHVFSIGNVNSHVVTEVLSGPDARPTYSVRFRPPLRQGWPQGTPLNFVTPVCEMRLTGSEQHLPLDGLRMASGQLDFVEA